MLIDKLQHVNGSATLKSLGGDEGAVFPVSPADGHMFKLTQPVDEYTTGWYLYNNAAWTKFNGSGSSASVTATKTFTTNEDYVIDLPQSSVAPIVSVSTELATTIYTENNAWEVAATSSQYESELDSVEYHNTGVALKPVSTTQKYYSHPQGYLDSTSISGSGNNQIQWSDDGMHLYVSAGGYNIIRRYTPNVAYTPSSGLTLQVDNVPNGGADTAMFITSDGYVYYAGGSSVYNRTMGTGGYSFDGIGSVNQMSTAAATDSDTIRAMWVSDDGQTVLLGRDDNSNNNDRIEVWTMSIPHNLNTMTLSSTIIDITSTHYEIRDIEVVEGGTVMYTVGRKGVGSPSLHRWEMATPYDFANAVEVSSDSTIAILYSISFNNDGSLISVLTDSSDYIRTYSSIEDLHVYDDSEFFPVFTAQSGQIDTTNWSDLNGITISENTNGQELYYALSFDNRTTWIVGIEGQGTREIVRNNGGTWEYNSDVTYASSTWTAASVNTEMQAMKDAMTISVNKINGGTMNAVADPTWPALDGELDLCRVLKTNDTLKTPTTDLVSLSYDGAIKYKGAILGTDYDYEQINSTQVQITALLPGNLKIGIVG